MAGANKLEIWQFCKLFLSKGSNKYWLMQSFHVFGYFVYRRTPLTKKVIAQL
jgi:hypothetical protein